MESAKIICASCGLEMPRNAPAGLCPVCLLSAAMYPFDETQFASLQIADQRQDSTTQFAISASGPIISPKVSVETSSVTDQSVRYLGDYEVYEEIGRGGMGAVYRARQIRLNRRVALKMIRSGKFSSDAEIRRLRIEAEAAAQLDHPAIVPVFEIGEHDGLHFFTMAFVDGQPLSSRLNAGPLPPREAAKLLFTIAMAVHYAHECGVIHRDLKPGNILIDASGQPRISDFGLAKLVSPHSNSLSGAEVLGTPSYMPPELAEGNSQQFGPLSDVYSLGAILYATLTGSPPFHAASSLETLRQVVEREPVAPRRFNPAIPKDLETIALKCLRKNPSQRYVSAQAIAEDLDRFLNGHPVTAMPVTRIERVWRWSCRRPELSLLFLAILLLLGVGTTAFAYLHHQHVRKELQVRAEGLVHQIETAEYSELPRLILASSQFANTTMIEHELSRHRSTSAEAAVRLSLARSLLHKQLEIGQCEEWLHLALEDLAIVAQITAPIASEVRARMLSLAVAPPAKDPITEQNRLRAVCLLISTGRTDSGMSLQPAAIDSADPLVAPRYSWEQQIDWESVSRSVLTLLAENPGDFKAAYTLLRPAVTFLQAPIKNQIFNQTQLPAERHLAISFLAELLHNDPAGIADLACLVDTTSFHLMTRHVERMKKQIIPELMKILPLDSISPRPAPQPDLSIERTVPTAISLRDRQVHAASRQAMAVAWLYRLGQFESTWRLLRSSPDPTLRYLVLDRICAVGGTVRPVISQLGSYLGCDLSELTPAVSLQGRPICSNSDLISELQMVVLLAGEMAKRETLMAEEVQQLTAVFALFFRDHPDAGIHSSCEWALNQIGAASQLESLCSQLTPLAIADGRNWFVTDQGATMALFRGPIQYQAGADWTDPDRVASTVIDPVSGKTTNVDREPRLMRHIGRDFAIGIKEVSLREFLKFDPSYHERTNLYTSSTLQHPVNNMSWYHAAEYCNWLSQQAGIDSSQWCFIPNHEDRYAEGMTLAANYLERTGYRMPTEVEWEYACRAGTTTPRFFGNARELMPQFVWFRDNSRERSLIVPGTLKPNPAGLFDVFGNVIEWCIEGYAGRPVQQQGVVPDSERGLTVDAEAWRVLRGGHLYAEDHELRATDLWTFRPLVADGHFGLRIARTIKVHSSTDAVSP